MRGVTPVRAETSAPAPQRDRSAPSRLALCREPRAALLRPPPGSTA